MSMTAHVVNIRDATDDKSEPGLLKLLELSLEEMDINFDGVISQTYDRASVMSGYIGGVPMLLCDLCGRDVSYIRCYCHRVWHN